MSTLVRYIYFPELNELNEPSSILSSFGLVRTEPSPTRLVLPSLSMTFSWSETSRINLGSRSCNCYLRLLYDEKRTDGASDEPYFKVLRWMHYVLLSYESRKGMCSNEEAISLETFRRFPPRL